MDQHPIPRQITTFEFKLIGFFTVKQFLYLLIGAGIGVIAYFLTPIPVLNYFVGGGVFGLFVIFALVKYNERSLDVWVHNFLRRLTSPSQFFFQKRNRAPSFLHDTPVPDPVVTQSHIDARQKLVAYRSTHLNEDIKTHKQISSPPTHDQKPNTKPLTPPEKTERTTNSEQTNKDDSAPLEHQAVQTSPHAQEIRPFIAGVVKNKKEVPLPSMMVYIKDTSGQIVRILKTNNKGVFATFHPLTPNSYTLEIKDLTEKHFFDTIKFTSGQAQQSPFIIYSKELL